MICCDRHASLVVIGFDGATDHVTDLIARTPPMLSALLASIKASRRTGSGKR